MATGKHGSSSSSSMGDLQTAGSMQQLANNLRLSIHQQ
jgi:hypothetical protein